MTLYEGRIAQSSNALMDAINRSLPVDIRLLPYDIATNRAWAAELEYLGVLSGAECAKIFGVLGRILERYQSGDFDVLPDDEDVHTLVERLLTDELGETGARIHTGRSRNDQVACDLRLYLMDALNKLVVDARATIRVLIDQAQAGIDWLMPGTTHMQPAQPITLGFFLGSAAAALQRDVERLLDAGKRAALCPLGSGALAGSGFAVDRERLAHALGFAAPLPNALDAIADRDAAQETATACAVLAGHLSRYAEQFVLWSNPQFGYLSFSDRWSTGSSMMPQKRNPDAMELVRAKAARVIGQTTTLLTLTKGLPLSYAKDLQEDKQALFDVVDQTGLALKVFAAALGEAVFKRDKMEQALTADLLATDLADRLAAAGVPFRQAHGRVGTFVTRLEEADATLLSIPEGWAAESFPELDLIARPLDYEQAVKGRAVFGGTAPERVREQLAGLETWLKNG